MTRLTLAVISLFCCVNTALANVPAVYREALVALYNSTNGANWINNANWLVGDPCANNWYGIECYASNGMVIRLSGNNLVGNIPPEIGNINGLYELWLGYNQLTGSIPAELGKLTNLFMLYLNKCQLTGNIPIELGKMTNLADIFLSYNQLTGNIPGELGDLPNLNSITFHHNQLTGNIPANLVKASTLRSVQLGWNQLSGTIPAWLAQTNIRALELEGNQFTGSIPAELGQGRFTHLNFESNMLTGEMPTAITKLAQNASEQSPLILRFSWNALHTDNEELDQFLDSHPYPGQYHDWSATQTVPPTNVTISNHTDDSVTISWDAIEYTADEGGYHIWYSTSPGGPYVDQGLLSGKHRTSWDWNGLFAVADKYYIVMATETKSHPDNANDVMSGYSAEVMASRPLRYVALGDSFSSGEGIGEPYNGCKGDTDSGEKTCTDNHGNDSNDNRCARNSLAYSTANPGRKSTSAILSGNNVERYLYACSGGITEDIAEVDGGGCDHEDGCEWSAPDNVLQIDRPKVADADLITITVGGNDIGFATILKKCVVGAHPCEKDGAPGIGTGDMGPWVQKRLNELYSKLTKTFKAINSKSGNKPLVVIGYPRLFQSGLTKSCGVAVEAEFEEEDITWVNSIADDANKIIKCAAESVGALFVPVNDEFKGRLCHPSGESDAINELFFRIGFDGGRHEHESFHPNAYGHQQIAQITNTAIKRIMTNGELPERNGTPTTPENCKAFQSQVALESYAETIPLDTLGSLKVSVMDSNDCNTGSDGAFANGQQLRLVGEGYSAFASVTVKFYFKGSTANIAVLLANADGMINDVVTLSTSIESKGIARIEAFGNGFNGAQRILSTMFSIYPSVKADGDSDGIPDICDLCPQTTSTNQSDGDHDGIGDVCDAFPQDINNDSDGDGISAEADPCPFDPLNDSDGDNFCASQDNCPNIQNFDQNDADLDGMGDACDDCKTNSDLSCVFENGFETK